MCNRSFCKKYKSYRGSNWSIFLCWCLLHNSGFMFQHVIYVVIFSIYEALIVFTRKLFLVWWDLILDYLKFQKKKLKIIRRFVKSQRFFRFLKRLLRNLGRRSMYVYTANIRWIMPVVLRLVNFFVNVGNFFVWITIRCSISSLCVRLFRSSRTLFVNSETERFTKIKGVASQKSLWNTDLGSGFLGVSMVDNFSWYQILSVLAIYDK